MSGGARLRRPSTSSPAPYDVVPPHGGGVGVGGMGNYPAGEWGLEHEHGLVDPSEEASTEMRRRRGRGSGNEDRGQAEVLMILDGHFRTSDFRT